MGIGACQEQLWSAHELEPLTPSNLDLSSSASSLGQWRLYWPATWRLPTFMSHAPRSIYPIQNAGNLAILYYFVFFYLVFAGPGPWSIDARGSEESSA